MKRAILIGFMGSGKTTLGKNLSKKLNIPFIDSDSEIEAMYSMSIGEIFGTFGEARFREMELELLKDLESEGEFVLATGGGMPCFGENIQRLNEMGTTFYLERSPKELAHRLRNAKTQRPLIKGLSDSDLLSFIENKLSEREDAYKQALFTLAREEQDVKTILQILNHLHPHQKN